MIFVLGFLVASLIALAIAPAFWRRAIRLSTRRLEMQLPLSPEEIRAGRDMLRAEFAVEQRRLEQRAEDLNRVHAADMVELGHREAMIAAQEADLLALSRQGSERGGEITALQRALAETSAELAATAKDSYDTAGLIERRDTQIRELAVALREADGLAAEQRDTLAARETNLVLQGKTLAVQAETIARLEGELSTLQLQHQADQVTLKSAAARIADREEALEASGKREKELIRQRQLHAETTRATEAGYHEKIERLRSALVASQDAVDAAQRSCDALTQELATLRNRLPPQDAEEALLQREENEILRQTIKEIGAAVIRQAGSSLDAAPEDELEKSAQTQATISQKATA
jgi:hypothetical protein